MKELKYFSILEKLAHEIQRINGKSLIESAEIINVDIKEIEDFYNWFERIRIINNSKIAISKKLELLNISHSQLISEQNAFLLTKNVFDKKVPRYVCKYKPLNKYTEDMIKNNKLWLADLKSFNDLNEGLNPLPENIDDEYIQAYKEYLEQKHNNGEKIELNASELDNFKLYYENTIIKAIDKVRVSCFTKSKTNSQLWAYYADDNKGICFEFDVLKDIDLFYTLLPISYTSDYPKFELTKDFSKFPVKETFLTKAENWSIEEEIRLVKYEDSSLYEFKKESLINVIFGAKVEQNKINETIQLFRYYNYNCSFYQCDKSKSSFEYRLIEIKS